MATDTVSSPPFSTIYVNSPLSQHSSLVSSCTQAKIFGSKCPSFIRQHGSTVYVGMVVVVCTYIKYLSTVVCCSISKSKYQPPEVLTKGEDWHILNTTGYPQKQEFQWKVYMCSSNRTGVPQTGQMFLKQDRCSSNRIGVPQTGQVFLKQDRCSSNRTGVPQTGHSAIQQSNSNQGSYPDCVSHAFTGCEIELWAL